MHGQGEKQQGQIRQKTDNGDVLRFEALVVRKRDQEVNADLRSFSREKLVLTLTQNF